MSKPISTYFNHCNPLKCNPLPHTLIIFEVPFDHPQFYINVHAINSLILTGNFLSVELKQVIVIAVGSAITSESPITVGY